MFTCSNHSNSFSLSYFTLVTAHISLYLCETFITTAMFFMFQACVLWRIFYVSNSSCQQYCIWGYQDSFGPFFYENILSRKEAPKCKTSGFHPFIGFCAQKIVAFVVFCLPNSVLLAVFTWFAFLCCRNLFVKKKIDKQTQNCPDDHKYNTTELYPSQPPYAEFFCVYLYLFVRISFYSWWPVKICDHLWLLVKSF